MGSCLQQGIPGVGQRCWCSVCYQGILMGSSTGQTGAGPAAITSVHGPSYREPATMFLEQLLTNVLMLFLFLKISPRLNCHPQMVSLSRYSILARFSLSRSSLRNNTAPPENRETQIYPGPFSPRPQHRHPLSQGFISYVFRTGSNMALPLVPHCVQNKVNKHICWAPLPILMNSVNQMIDEPESKYSYVKLGNSNENSNNTLFFFKFTCCN